jgi:predicted alpha/beta-fold hydrolase
LDGVKKLIAPHEPNLRKCQIPGVSYDGALKSTSVKEFDESITAPLHGYKNADDYYTQCSPGPKLGRIQVDTLIIRCV